jgi:hypothetical protein
MAFTWVAGTWGWCSIFTALDDLRNTGPSSRGDKTPTMVCERNARACLLEGGQWKDASRGALLADGAPLQGNAEEYLTLPSFLSPKICHVSKFM